MRHFGRVGLIVVTLTMILFTSCSGKQVGMNVSSEEIQKRMVEYSTPGEGHKQLSGLVGRWRATTKYWMSPDLEPEESTGTLTRSWVLGKRFLKEVYVDRSKKSPFRGVGYLGYDNIKNTYITSWMDTMGTGIHQGIGSFDTEANSFSFASQASCPFSGHQQDTLSVLTIISPKKHTYDVYRIDGSERIKVMEIVYLRS